MQVLLHHRCVVGEISLSVHSVRDGNIRSTTAIFSVLRMILGAASERFKRRAMFETDEDSRWRLGSKAQIKGVEAQNKAQNL
jgi:hypothetical protein